MSILYKESRIACLGSFRRIALDPLILDGIQVTAIDEGDTIRYIVLNEDGTVLQESTDAVYEQIYTTNVGVAIMAWAGEITVGLIVQTIKIIWEVKIGAAHDLWADQIDVIASPFANRAMVLTTDAWVV